MGIAIGGSGSRLAEINVVPLIDILLVLLIIFMVINAAGSERAGGSGSAAWNRAAAG